MADQGFNQDEFIDLYNALDLPQDAEVKSIRKRVNALYLESQQNLDHRNPRKRLHYQQLYEIILPQARLLLLDDARRSEYDRYLEAFKSGTKVEATAEEVSPKFEVTPHLTATERMEEEGVDPEKLAEQREDTWAKWKQGLRQEVETPKLEDKVTETTEKLSAPRSAPQSAPVQPVRGHELTSGAAGFHDAALNASGKFGGSKRLSVEDKRRQDQQRIKIIQRVAQNAMFLQGAIKGSIALVISLIVLYVGVTYLPLSDFLGDTVTQFVYMGWIPLALIIAFISGRNAGVQAKQDKMSDLSRSSYEDLKKRYGE